jgi:hypothetical protein
MIFFLIDLLRRECKITRYSLKNMSTEKLCERSGTIKPEARKKKGPQTSLNG